MFDLAGKVALISGGARGQGAAAAELFVELGAKVVIGDVLDAEGEKVAAGNASIVYTHLDVTVPEQWKGAVDLAVEKFGSLDILVNNAGIVGSGEIESQPLDEYMRIIMVNQVGTFLGMQAAVPAMRRAGGGSIVNVSSVAGVIGTPGPITAYTASKFAVRGMTKIAAIELGRYNIRVNCMIPGAILTPMNTSEPGMMAALEQSTLRQPVPRFAEAREPGQMVAFLASDASAFCTGGDYVVDGGILAGMMPDTPPVR